MPTQVGPNHGWRVYDPPREQSINRPRRSNVEQTWAEMIAERDAARAAVASSQPIETLLSFDFESDLLEPTPVPRIDADPNLTVLPRTGAKGQFVLYPKEWSPQWRDPRNRRFQTKCDMLAGPCSCGRRHMPEDGDVQENLQRYGCRIETLQQWRERLYGNA